MNYDISSRVDYLFRETLAALKRAALFCTVQSHTAIVEWCERYMNQELCKEKTPIPVSFDAV